MCSLMKANGQLYGQPHWLKAKFKLSQQMPAQMSDSFSAGAMA